ncbi:MAG TPA: hypothetical protein VL201_04265 [Patescibacteria group bacterium]|jgi:hypothetical protein|nr:hypothetical protein [Patescibacteria group bacterium]
MLYKLIFGFNLLLIIFNDYTMGQEKEAYYTFCEVMKNHVIREYFDPTITFDANVLQYSLISKDRKNIGKITLEANNQRKEVLDIFQYAIDKAYCLRSLMQVSKDFHTLINGSEFHEHSANKWLNYLSEIIKKTAIINDIHFLNGEYATAMYPLDVQNKALNQLDLYTKYPKILFLSGYGFNDTERYVSYSVDNLIHSDLYSCFFLQKKVSGLYHAIFWTYNSQQILIKKKDITQKRLQQVLSGVLKKVDTFDINFELDLAKIILPGFNIEHTSDELDDAGKFLTSIYSITKK